MHESNIVPVAKPQSTHGDMNSGSLGESSVPRLLVIAYYLKVCKKGKRQLHLAELASSSTDDIVTHNTVFDPVM